jgi:hypothetical protein
MQIPFLHNKIDVPKRHKLDLRFSGQERNCREGGKRKKITRRV